MRLGRLTCHAVDDPACSCEPAGDGGDATGGCESGCLTKAFGEGDGEREETLGTGPGTEPVPLEDLQQETNVSTAPGEGASAACVSPAEI